MLLGAACGDGRPWPVAAETHRLEMLQFLSTQTSREGVLEGFLSEHPEHVLALYFAVLTANLTPLSSTNSVGSSQSRKVYKLRRRRSEARNESILSCLAESMFFQQMPILVRGSLLGKIKDALEGLEPRVFTGMLKDEGVLWALDRPTLVLQSSAMVTWLSQVFRPFKEHLRWCEDAVAKLEGQKVGLTTTPYDFAFFKGDLSSSHTHAQAQSWVLDHLLAPFISLWVRAATDGSDKVHPLCASVGRLARTYEMSRDLRPSDSAISMPVRHKADPQQKARFAHHGVLRLDEDAQGFMDEEPAALLSVGKMYGISMCLEEMICDRQSSHRAAP